MAFEKHTQNISENSSMWKCLQPFEPCQNPYEFLVFSLTPNGRGNGSQKGWFGMRFGTQRVKMTIWKRV